MYCCFFFLHVLFFKQSSFPHLQALTWAARQGHKNVILKLLELGANKMIQTKDGRTPSEIAKRNNHLEVFTCVLYVLLYCVEFLYYLSQFLSIIITYNY